MWYDLLVMIKKSTWHAVHVCPCTDLSFNTCTWIYDASFSNTILGSNKIDEARRRKEEREEKRQQRQKEIEEKRAARKGGGALKLGTKKTALDWLLPFITFEFEMVKFKNLIFYVIQFPFKFVACLFQFFQWPIVISFEE